MRHIRSLWFPVVLAAIVLGILIVYYFFSFPDKPQPVHPLVSADNWTAPDINGISNDEEGQKIRYGHDLIKNTAMYFGPRGSITSISNGMNCQNCHLSAGALSFGNCFSAVASTYPKFRERSGRVESIEFRINDCMLRSLNGQTIDSNSREMQAMVAYITWLGKEVRKGIKPTGAGLEDLPYLDRAADPEKGKIIFFAKCQSCHGANGAGLLSHDSTAFVYPPLWGDRSYNTGAGLFRLSRFASFVKNNMPWGANHGSPQLTDEEAWDVAAFVNSQPRPKKIFASDWPRLASKAIDIPDGPYADTFSETQHKYGPYAPIAKANRKK
jgi:thiosulfate dehydrogenase